MYKINKLQGYIVKHREYSQYFIVTINGVSSLKIVHYCMVHLKLTCYCKSTMPQRKKNF